MRYGYAEYNYAEHGCAKYGSAEYAGEGACYGDGESYAAVYFAVELLRACVELDRRQAGERPARFRSDTGNHWRC